MTGGAVRDKMTCVQTIGRINSNSRRPGLNPGHELPRTCWTAVLVFCIVSFMNATAWAGGFFIYRDLPTGIYSNANQFISYRYMRHIWTTSDDVTAVVVQQGGYEGHGLALYKTLDEGQRWSLDTDISADDSIVSDGVLDAANDLLLVTSLVSDDEAVDVDFVRMTYDPVSHNWTAPPEPVTVFASGADYRGTRASIAIDSKGVIWCAFRLEDVAAGTFEIRVYYSVDGGSEWNDSGHSFGTLNYLDGKCAKVIGVGQRLAMIYQDEQGSSSAPRRYKVWAYREDSEPLQGDWTSQYIAMMSSDDDDPYGSHWSVAADDSGNIHLSYEDNGINYVKYDAASGAWTAPRKATFYGGHYSSLSAGSNGDIYLFARNRNGEKVIGRRYSAGSGTWSRWVPISVQNYNGMLRMSSPARFSGHLPLVYQVNGRPPFELVYNLFDTGE